jgi:phosphoglycolate phosphatase-like HAD superfamily hydrolase
MNATITCPHVLFDLDGTLIDTRAAVTECYRRVFRDELGRDFPPAEVEPALLFAMRPAELFAAVAPDHAEALHAAYRATYPSCLPLVRTFAGARELVLALAANGRHPSLVTNKGLERTRLDLGTIGLDPAVFAAIVTAEDTAERKPDPAPILLGLKRAGALAADAVYVGDGPHDIEAAHAAAMSAIAVTYGFYDRPALSGHEPDAIVDTMAELAALLDVDLAEAPAS